MCIDIISDTCYKNIFEIIFCILRKGNFLQDVLIYYRMCERIGKNDDM